MWHKKTILFN